MSTVTGNAITTSWTCISSEGKKHLTKIVHHLQIIPRKTPSPPSQMNNTDVGPYCENLGCTLLNQRRLWFYNKTVSKTRSLTVLSGRASLQRQINRKTTLRRPGVQQYTPLLQPSSHVYAIPKCIIRLCHAYFCLLWNLVSHTHAAIQAQCSRKGLWGRYHGLRATR
jgi:hypothetical protein